ncbi:MAG: N-6 DNA methylase [Victivallaceae bacterium]|nr:N-6 DNA methylase [Victivallaceae bacterium]
MAKKKNGNGTNEPLEKQLWKSADKLRKNIDAAEYKHVVLGLIFLKYISDAFEELFEKLKAGEGEYAGADPEDKDEYKAENVFFVPTDARWSFLLSKAKQPTIGKTVDEAMDAIEKENPSLKGVLPKVYARQNLDPTSLGELIDMIGNIALGDAKSRSADILGHVFEYFLGEFALAEGKKGGQFYTPRSVVELLVKMLEPYKGRVFDPCCGSGGMFVQSEKFVTEHQGKINDISIYGQESNQTTWRLAKMNLAIRGLDSSQVKWNNEGSFLNNAHKDLKCDYIIANPPFNVSDWSGDLLRKDGRWQYGTPPTGNANYAWIQHFIYHLAPSGQAGFVLAKGSLTSKTSGEGEIRKRLIEEGLVDCIVNLPAKLFLNTQIPASLWFTSRKSVKPSLNPSQREGNKFHYRGGFDFSGLVNEARQLRKNQTKAEELFWELVRNKKFIGLKFRRQHQIGSYVVDFYCHSEKLIIEFDGEVHNTEERKLKDKKRDAYLTSIGNTVLRFQNEDIFNNPENVFNKITKSFSPSGRDGREGEILFIDARNMGHLINRRTRELSKEDIQLIADTYHNWRNPDGDYEDVKGFCNAASIERVKELDYVLTPGRYVGLADEEDDFDFNERFTKLKAEFEEQLKEETVLNKRITENLAKIDLPVQGMQTGLKDE